MQGLASGGSQWPRSSQLPTQIRIEPIKQWLRWTGLIISAVLVLVFALVFDLTALASLGSAVALAVFVLVTITHMKLRQETGAKFWLLGLAALTTLVTLFAFAIKTYQDEPRTFVAMIAIFVLAIAIDLVWKRIRGGSPTIPDAEAAPSEGAS